MFITEIGHLNEKGSSEAQPNRIALRDGREGDARVLELTTTYGDAAAKPGLEKFGMLADCSKRTFTWLGDPPGARCDYDS